MRIRTIKPDYWTHPVMTRQDDSTKMLGVALLNYADDEGYFYAAADLIRSALRPTDAGLETTIACLGNLCRIGYIEIRESPTHGPIGKIVSFSKHQKVDRGNKSRIKDLYDSSNVRESFVDQSSNDRRWNREQGIGNGTGNREDIAPSVSHSVQPDSAETSPETSAQDQHQAEHLAEHLAEHGEEAEFAWEWDSEDSPEIHLHKAETHKPADVGGTRAAPPAVALDGFPLAKKGAEWSLTQDKLTEWQEAYPYIDVLAECRRARQWLRDNPAKRKTERGMSAFLSRWLNKGMDRGSTVQRPVTQPSPYRTEPEGWMDAYHRCKGRFDAKQQAMFAEQVAKGWYGMGITFREIIEDELEGRCTIL
jgi:hypothetical protein